MSKAITGRGGPGRGQGRHLKYGEATVTVITRCPASKAASLRKTVNDKLAAWAAQHEKRLAKKQAKK